jgi:dTDP-glucose 4,6-dehydratase
MLPLLTLCLLNISLDAVLHLAAESHVDRSITDPLSFKTKCTGTMNLLNEVSIWTNL